MIQITHIYNVLRKSTSLCWRLFHVYLNTVAASSCYCCSRGYKIRIVWQYTVYLLKHLSSSPQDNPELWDFTLDGIQELEAPAGGPSSTSSSLQPSTPGGSHQMLTRSKTPQRGASPSLRPPVRPHEPPPHGQVQGGNQPQYHNQHPRTSDRTGETG